MAGLLLAARDLVRLGVTAIPGFCVLLVQEGPEANGVVRHGRHYPIGVY